MEQRLSDLIEPWSNPTPHLAEQAQVWHTRRFAAWLLRAGAEPRLGQLLASGPTAIARWMLLLDEQGIDVVRASSTLERPLPRPLTEHRGDHFNRKLFLMEGLDKITKESSLEERGEYWRTLEGQRGQLKQSATWVVLLTTLPETLSDALRWAPSLMESLGRVCWIWEVSERSSSVAHDTSVDPLTSSQGRTLIYSAFCAAAAHAEPVDHLTLGRIFRCGYPKPARSANSRWRWSYRLWRGEARDPQAARFGQVGVTEKLSDHVTADDAVWALRGRARAATPARHAQWIERARESDQAWLIDQSIEPTELNTFDTQAHSALKHIRDWSVELDGAPPPLATVQTLETALEAEIEASTKRARAPWILYAQIVEWLTQSFAAHEDLGACVRVNQRLYTDDRAWPEVRFCAGERALELALFSQDHAEARRVVEGLKALDIVLAAPHFSARYLRARSQQLGALDPARGAWELEEAQRIEERFGLKPAQV